MEPTTPQETRVFQSYIRVLADQRSFLLETAVVVELVDSRNSTLTPIPGSKPAMVGMLNHRGRVVPVFDLRTLIGAKSRSEETEDLKAFLAAREQDHVAWLEDLKSSVRLDTKFTKALDPTKCAFGKWYESLKNDADARSRLTNNNSTIERILNSFDDPHRSIHGIAEEVLALANSGNHSDANAIIDRAWDTELAAMRRLFGELLETYAEAVSGRIVLLSLDGTGAGVLVDEVLEVAEYEDLVIDEEAGLGSALLPDGTLAFPIPESELLSLIGAEAIAA